MHACWLGPHPPPAATCAANQLTGQDQIHPVQLFLRVFIGHGRVLGHEVADDGGGVDVADHGLHVRLEQAEHDLQVLASQSPAISRMLLELGVALELCARLAGRIQLHCSVCGDATCSTARGCKAGMSATQWRVSATRNTYPLRRNSTDHCSVVLQTNHGVSILRACLPFGSYLMSENQHVQLPCIGCGLGWGRVPGHPACTFHRLPWLPFASSNSKLSNPITLCAPKTLPSHLGMPSLEAPAVARAGRADMGGRPCRSNAAHSDSRSSK